MRETRVRSLGWEDALEKEMATHSSTLAWKIPWTEEPGRLQSMGSQGVGHDWTTSLSLSLVGSAACQCRGHGLLIREDPMCCGLTKPMHHNCWACALEPGSPRACAPQQEKPPQYCKVISLQLNKFILKKKACFQCQKKEWEAQAPKLESNLRSLLPEKSPQSNKDPAQS